MTVDRSRDLDPVETQEWLDSLAGVLQDGGPGGATFFTAKVKTG